MKLYTKTGDRGRTGLRGGKRVPKDSLRIKAIGEVDELNALLGLCWASNKDQKTSKVLHQLQQELFELGTDLSTPLSVQKKIKPVIKRISAEQVNQLEQFVDEYTEQVEPLKNFILPGGSQTAGYLHLGRAVCRRAERVVAALAKKEKIGNYVLPYLNRLSDLLFVMARFSNLKAKIHEEKWLGNRIN